MPVQLSKVSEIAKRFIKLCLNVLNCLLVFLIGIWLQKGNFLKIMSWLFVFWLFPDRYPLAELLVLILKWICNRRIHLVEVHELLKTHSLSVDDLGFLVSHLDGLLLLQQLFLESLQLLFANSLVLFLGDVGFVLLDDDKDDVDEDHNEDNCNEAVAHVKLSGCVQVEV